MEKEQRTRLQKATQDARRLLEEEFTGQLLETYDINVASGRWNEEPGAHLQAEQRLLRKKLLAWIEHRSAQINDEKEALLLALREMAFTALNRFVALKLMEARELVRPCVSGGLESEGFQEFTAVAQGLLVEQESSYRLYLETIFEDVSRELRALFDPRDPASLLWPKRTALLELLDILNRPELAELWREDETLGWIYQYFNGDAERKKMREESAAPRNSRELAVRNQFFTPRYVVEFLTDNTLGRIWYEMCQGKTGLKERCRYLVRRPKEIWLQPGEEAPAEVVADEALNQEELLRQPVHIPYRPLKDPREIRMLDPACGSMHFGLYAFDLYLAIYEEAWEIAQGPDEQAKQGEAFAAFGAYAAGFADKGAFLREVPRLILQHNIHGIDIDPRATQIARLTLWLRAQRAWQEQQLQVADRPPVTRSNVVCAEPMPGEKELLGDFVEQQFPAEERPAFAFLLEMIFERMSLAGTAGSLLRIEEEIRSAIAEARTLAKSQGAPRQTALFAGYERSEQAELDLGGLNDEQFWQAAEQRIYQALETYAEQAEGGGGLQRLFADDAARGFAFIDLCRKRYDVVVMNPPFGSPSLPAEPYLQQSYPESAYEIYGQFLLRARSACDAYVGAITSRGFLYLSNYFPVRNAIYPDLSVFLDLGANVLDSAFIEVCAYILSSARPGTLVQCIDARRTRPKAQNIGEGADFSFNNSEVFFFDLANLASLPTKPFCYETPAELLGTHAWSKTLESVTGGIARVGLATGDNERFVRCYWEVPRDAINQRWRWHGKGGEYLAFKPGIHLVVDWKGDGLGIEAFFAGARIRKADVFFQPAVTYSRRSLKGLSFRILPAGAICGEKGPVIIAPGHEYAVLALANSSPYKYLVSIQCAASAFEIGTVQKAPVPTAFPEIEPALSAHGRNLVSLMMLLALWDETDVHFQWAPFWRGAGSLREMAVALTTEFEAQRGKARDVLERVDQLLLAAYHWPVGRSPEDEHEKMLEGFQIESPIKETCRLLLSVGIGAIFGQFPRHFERQAFKEVDPYAPLPQGQVFSSAEVVRAEGGGKIDGREIVVDDETDADGADNLAAHLHAVLHENWGEQSVAIELEASEILGVQSLRYYFRKTTGFFADHLKRYSKSRRQAPIYWQLSAGNGSYSAWLYYHRFTSDTLYRVLRDFVEPRIQEAEREQFELESQGGLSGDAAGLLQEAQALLQDLRLFKSELELVAPLWNPNLNDGVIINHAILWRITPYTPWQKKCKECWDKLVNGDYDWAHLAFHLWPERVIGKCTSDRSLAIAHGLEERLWQETSKGNWLQRQLPEAELEALLAEYSKPAVQNALERFLAAPPPVAAARTRAPRAAKSSSTGTTRRPRGPVAAVDAETSRQTLLVLTAAPAEGLGRNAIAELLAVEAASLTAVIKQLKEGGQIEQLGAARGAKYRLSESGLAAVESQAEEDE